MSPLAPFLAVASGVLRLQAHLTPAGQLVHGTRGFLSLSSPGLLLELPGSGTVLLTVSERPINRFMRNDFKRAQESTMARQVADTLVARGACLVAAA